MKKNILLAILLSGVLVLGLSIQTHAMKRKRDGGLYTSDKNEENPNKSRKTDGQINQQNSGANSGARSNPDLVFDNSFQRNFKDNNMQDDGDSLNEPYGSFFIGCVKSMPERFCGFVKSIFCKQGENEQEKVSYDVQAYQRACNGDKNLVGVNLRGAPLAGKNLEGVDLTGADLTGADLRGAILNKAKIVCANLSGAHLEPLDGQQTHMEEAIIINANMSGAHCERCYLNRTKIINSNLNDVNFTKAEMNDAFFISSVGSGQSLTFLSTIPPMPLQLETLDELYKIFGRKLAQVEVQALMNLKVTYGNIIDPSRQTDAISAIFTGAQLNNTIFIGVDLSRATLSGMELNRVRFIRCLLHYAQVHGVLAKGTAFCSCNGNKIDEKNGVAVFENVIFSEDSNIYNTDFIGAIIRNVLFLKTVIKKTNFSKATFNRVRFINSKVKNINMSEMKAKSEGNYVAFDNTELANINFSQSKINGLVIQNRKIMGVNLDFSYAEVEHSVFLGEVIRRDSNEERIGGFHRSESKMTEIGVIAGVGVGGGLALGATCVVCCVLFPGIGLLGTSLVALGTGLVGVPVGGGTGAHLSEKIQESNQDFAPININSAIYGLNLKGSTFYCVKFANMFFDRCTGFNDIANMENSVFDNVVASDPQHLEALKNRRAFVNGKPGDGHATLYLTEEDKTLNKMSKLLLACLPGAINAGISLATAGLLLNGGDSKKENNVAPKNGN